MPAKAAVIAKKSRMSSRSVGRRKLLRASSHRLARGAGAPVCGRLSFKRTITNMKASAQRPAATKAGRWSASAVGLAPATMPPSQGPMVKPKPKAAPIMPMPLARFSGLVTSVM